MPGKVLNLLESRLAMSVIASKRKSLPGLTIILTIALFMLTSCGSGGAGTQDDPNRVSRIEITPGTALLSELDQTRQLKAVAYNASGDVVAADFTWESSNPSLMSVDSQGQVTNHDYVGSSVISASADGIAGQATLLAVGLMPNSVLVSDEQVLDTPQLLDTSTPPDIGSHYLVTLEAQVMVSVGDILLASESAPVGGRVVEVVDTAGGKQVTLELIPFNQMFSKLKIDQTYHLTHKDVEIPQAVSDGYVISENPDGSLNFTPRTSNRVRPGTAQRNDLAIGVPVGTVADPESLLSCKAELTPQTSPLPLTLNTLPVSNGLTIDMDLIVDYDSQGSGLQKLALGGQAKLEIKVTPTLDIAVEGKLSCEMELVTFTIPVGGPIAVVLGGQIPIGLGFELGGKLTLAQIGAEIQAKAQLDAEIGVQYNPTLADWEMINRSNSSADAEYKWVVPDVANLDAQFRLEPAVKGFLFADLELGNRFISSLRFETFKMNAGPVESAKLSTVNGQVADTGFASEYKMALNFNGKLGAQAQALFNFLSINVAAFDLYNIDLDLFKSPAMTSARASVGSFSAGDLVEFTVELNRDTLQYFSFTSLEPYNIDDIIIYRKIDTNGTITTQEVARTSASLGQSTFELSWIADSSGSIGSDFYVFVDTRALEIPLTFGTGIPYLDEMELGIVSGPASNQLAFRSNRINGIYDYDIYLVNADSTGLTPLIGESTAANLSPRSWSPDGKKLLIWNGSSPAVVDASGLNLTDLPGSASNAEVAWSPDGSRICYEIFAGNTYNLKLVDADGSSNPLTLTDITPPGPGAYTHLAFRWHPNGNSIVFDNLDDSAIFTIGANGSGLTDLTPSVTGKPSYPQLSYDGSKIAYRYRESNVTDLYVMSYDGSFSTQVTNLSLTTYLGGYQFSPNSHRLAYITSDELGRGTLHSYDALGGAKQSLYTGPQSTTIYGPYWSPDGSKIAFYSTGIFVINADGTGLSQLTSATDSDPAWSPDGAKIAFTRHMGGSDYDIFVMNADGSNPINVSSSSGSDINPVWRP